MRGTKTRCSSNIRANFKQAHEYRNDIHVKLYLSLKKFNVVRVCLFLSFRLFHKLVWKVSVDIATILCGGYFETSKSFNLLLQVSCPEKKK